MPLRSPFLPRLPLLSSSSLPPPLPWYPSVDAALSFALATTVTAGLATTIAMISSHRHGVALVCLRIPCYCPCSCHCRVAPALTTVVAAALPLPWHLLPLLPPPLLPRNPRPCRRCRRDTPFCRRVAHALATLAVIFAAATLPPLLLIPPLKLIFWLIVMFPQPLTLLPLFALYCCR